jgi:benzoate/toluate 1,2-dioxygenase beta subunit
MTVAELEAFVQHEARLLDERRFDEWVALFAADGYYWVPTQPEQKDPAGTVSLFYDDLNAMKARFARLRHPRIHVQTPPSRTQHVVSGTRIEEADESRKEYLVSSNFIMLEYRPGQEQRLFGGTFRHRLRDAGERPVILMKRVDLINCDASFGSMAIPF